MWRTYLDLQPGSTLFPLPWVTWLLNPRPQVRVFEIRDAVGWARLAATYPQPAEGLMYLAWPAVSEDGSRAYARLVVV